MKILLIIGILVWSSFSFAEQTDTQKQATANELVFKGYKAYKSEKYEDAAKYYIESLQYWATLDAITNLCNLYLYGQGIPQDFNIARKLCEQSAAYNHKNAITMLGEIHLYGKGVPENKEKALIYSRKAADLGHTHAQYVTWLLLKESSPKEALLYLEKSASGGHQQAKEILSKKRNG